jgi:nitroreductase
MGVQKSTSTNIAAAEFLKLVRRRRSCRDFDPDRPVPEELLVSCVEAARLAPSSCNSQPWRFVLVRDAEKRQAVFQTARLPGINHQWLADAPVITALCAHKTLVPHRLAPLVSKIPYHYLDAAIAGEHFVLAATAVGLGSCWIGWFRQKPVKRILEIPRNIQVLALIALGFPKSPPEQRTPRLSPSEIAFADCWQNPFQQEAPDAASGRNQSRTEFIPFGTE